MSNFERCWKSLNQAKHPFACNIIELERAKPTPDRFVYLDLLLVSLEHDSSQQTITNALRLIASSLGMEYFCEPSSGLVTICGVLFVVDIDIPTLSVSISGTSVENIDNEINRYLSRLLNEGSWFQFVDSLRLIGHLDKSSQTKQSLSALSILQEDLKIIHEVESKNGIVEVVRIGHGFPEFYTRCMGPRICFFIDSADSIINL